MRHDLGQTMTDLGNTPVGIPKNLQQAEQDMRGAASALAANDPARAIPAQQNALQNLKQASDDNKKQLQQLMKQITLMNFGLSRDPLGRPRQEGVGPLMPGSDTKIPDQGQRKQTQEILETLRRRSGELTRPDYERDYLERLMKQF